jgi:two-component system NtrC family sensor kinase
MAEPSAIEKALQRERKRRKLAEHLLEEKSRDLFSSYKKLEHAHLDLHKNQRQLVHAEKMASIGILVAGIAHEINNPVGYVHSNITTLQSYMTVFKEVFDQLGALLELNPASEEFNSARQTTAEHFKSADVDYLSQDTLSLIAESLDGMSRISEIVKGLRTFAHVGSSDTGPVDINHCLKIAHTLTKSQLSSGCDISMELQPVSKVMASETKLGQVFLNLLVNASQAVEAGKGKICLRSFESNRQVVVEVQDNGCGISEENLDKLFTPFFTTKPVGEGTGLGLSISFGIIQELQGRLEVTSELGQGAKFQVSLPAM